MKDHKKPRTWTDSLDKRPKRNKKNNIKMDFREIRWNGMDWIDLVQDRDQWRVLLNTVMNLPGFLKMLGSS
jgi:hypothetical protein